MEDVPWAKKDIFKNKFIALNSYIRKEKWSQTNDITFHLTRKKKSKLNPKHAEKRKIIISISQ